MRRRFTLLDDPYYSAMLRVVRALEERDLDCCLVGGGAAQVWIASLRTDAGARTLGEEPVLKTALRRTRDLDFATRAEPASMLRVLNELAAEQTGAHVLGPRAMRLGPIALSLTIEPGDLAGMAALYDDFLDSRCRLSIRRGTSRDEVPTIGLAELVVTKLTRKGDKAKDLLDLSQLLASLKEAGVSLAVDRIRELLGHRSEPLALLDELVHRSEETA